VQVAFPGNPCGDSRWVRRTRTRRGSSVEDGSPGPGRASGAIVRLDRRGEPGPRVRDLGPEGLATRKVRGEPAFGAQQLKSRPRAADGGDSVVHGLLVVLVELILVPGARGVETNPFDRERGIATGPVANANPDHAAGRNSNNTEARAATRARESSVVAPVVRAPIIHVPRRGLNHEGDTHRGGPVEPVTLFGHVPGTRWADLSPESGNALEAAPNADRFARGPVSVKDLIGRASVSGQGGVYGQTRISLAPSDGGYTPRIWEQREFRSDSTSVRVAEPVRISARRRLKSCDLRRVAFVANLRAPTRRQGAFHQPSPGPCQSDGPRSRVGMVSYLGLAPNSLSPSEFTGLPRPR
jgi:hypothetical protein